MPDDYEIVTLTDGRRGFFYHPRFSGHILFQEIDEDNCHVGNPQMPFDDDCEIAEVESK